VLQESDLRTFVHLESSIKKTILGLQWQLVPENSCRRNVKLTTRVSESTIKIISPKRTFPAAQVLPPSSSTILSRAFSYSSFSSSTVKSSCVQQRSRQVSPLNLHIPSSTRLANPQQ